MIPLLVKFLDDTLRYLPDEEGSERVRQRLLKARDKALDADPVFEELHFGIVAIILYEEREALREGEIDVVLYRDNNLSLESP